MSDGYLQIRRGDTLLRVAPMVGNRMVAGRSPDVEVVLESDTVSRQHLEILRDEAGRWWVRDLGSRNGTAVNGKQITAHRLAYGDAIQVEDYVLTYVRAPAEGRGLQPRKPITAEGSLTRLTMVDSPVGAVRSLRDLGAPKIDASQLSRLVSLSAELLATEDDAARLHALCELMIGRDLRGTAAMALRVARSGDGDPELLGPPSLTGGRDVPHISRTVVRAVLASGTPVIASTAASGGGNTDLLKLSVVVQSMSAVAVPLGGGDDALNVLYVTFPSNYATAEWLALVSLAAELYRQAEAAWVARKAAQEQAILEEELERAHDIQTRLVPADFHLGQLDIGFGFEACKWVGGDYVDALPLRDGRVLLTVMDVCGKGLEAALIAAGLHTTVHVLGHEGLGLAALVRSLNRYLCETLPAASFVTMCALVIDPETGAIEHVNCGHPSPLVAGANGYAREIETHDHAPLGFLDVNEEIVVTRDQLPRDNVLCLFTDGLSELLNEQDRMLGVEGLSSLVGEVGRHTRDASATRLAGELRRALADFQGRAVAADDLSFILVLRTTPQVMRTGPQRVASLLPPTRR
ncbi:MAG: SpoIIE family protein phosphatase [Myxococcales bacterium]|nr:SpoIIE family protein phosphatase [Myxococcales bacterium]